MASTRQTRAILSLWAAPHVQVVIPFLTSLTTPWSRPTVFVGPFAGDTHPTAFHGTGEQQAFPMTCRFPRKQHEQLAAFLRLIQVTAPAAPDARLLLRTHPGQVPGLNAAVAVEVDGELVPTWSAPAVDVAVTFRVVEHPTDGG